ncbi:MAG: histidinol dehydrogenase [Candidatus Brockarchaeota archaeon]|nr:histidinol dehydrogenase [Candidatus Brockarchaeota archaeon]
MMLAVSKDSAKAVAMQLRGNVTTLPLSETEKIIEEVKQGGDKALKLVEERINRIKLESLEVKSSEVSSALSEVSVSTIDAMKVMVERLKLVETQLLKTIKNEVKIKSEGVEILYKFTPLKRVGIYVPRSSFAYPSSLIMASVPAILVGVKSIVVASPPYKDGKVDSKILVACNLMNINEIYRISGAQAIAALAYGTESIKPVEKIFGAGGKFVTAAKFLVSKQVSIDMLAGPTELLVLADESANQFFVAYDLLSQAEHGSGSLIVLASDSMKFIEEVRERLNSISKELASNVVFVLGEDIASLISFAEALAPEHIQVIGSKFEYYASEIKNSGVILIGEYTPSAASDYILGSNHILPTFGLAKSRSALSPIDFFKLSVSVKADSSSIKKLGPYAITLAKEEGFQMHAKAIEVRMNELS